MNFRKPLTSFIVLLVAGCTGNESAAYDSFGQPMDPEPVSAMEEVIPTLNGDTVSIRLKGTIDEVCQAKGCWITLKGDQKIRVTFKDYGFFVPKDVAGREVIIEGIASSNLLSEEMARHYAEDAGKEYDPSMQQEISIVASGVLIKKADQL